MISSAIRFSVLTSDRVEPLVLTGADTYIFFLRFNWQVVEISSLIVFIHEQLNADNVSGFISKASKATNPKVRLRYKSRKNNKLPLKWCIRRHNNSIVRSYWLDQLSFLFYFVFDHYNMPVILQAPVKKKDNNQYHPINFSHVMLLSGN